MKTGYIYKITSPSGRVYIGQTVSLKKRIKNYEGGHCKSQKLIHDSIKKHTWSTHRFDILETVTSENYIEEILDSLEKYYISYYKSNKRIYKNGKGLNLNGGGVGIGRSGRHSEEAIRKLSEKHSGENNYFYGKKHTDESRRKMSAYQKGKVMSPQARINIANGHKGLLANNRRAVICYNIDSSIYKEFCSIKEALVHFDKDPNRTTFISHAIKYNKLWNRKKWVFK